MKKYISKIYVICIIAFIMLTVSCGKAETTDNMEVTEDDSIESSEDLALVEEEETPDNTGLSENALVTEDNKELTVTPELIETTEPTVTSELIEITEPIVTPEPIKADEISESIESITTSNLETINETILFDRDGVRITAKELITDYWGKGISVLIENETDKNIGIMSNTYIVNNYMCMNFSFSSVAPDTESNDTIPLHTPNIAVKGIEMISDIAVSFLVFDNDSGENLFLTEEAVIQTSAYGTVKQPEMEDGKELLNQDGVRIVGKYVDENSSWGTGVLLYIENTSHEDLLFQCDDMVINGVSIFPFFSCLVNKKREALEAIAIMDFDLSDNNITEVKEIRLAFSGIDPINYNIAYTFEPVEIIVGE
jgi:hypothetical protein